MWLWLICIFQLAFAEETLRIAVLEFQTVQKMDPNFMLQLSDEARGGALDVFPPSTSKVSVLTRENLMDVLTQQGKDASCLEGNCAVGIGRNIGARFVVVGSVAQVEGVYRLTLGVYDTDSNDLLGQKSIQEASQVKLLGEVRPFAEGLIEQTLGGFDEGRLGVRKIGGKPDTWMVSGSTQGILEISEPRLKGSTISIDGRKVCDMREKSVCRVLVDQGNVTVSIERQYCDAFTETVSVERVSTLTPKLTCQYVVWSPPQAWKGLTVSLNYKSTSKGDEIPFGRYTLEVGDECQVGSKQLFIGRDFNDYELTIGERTRTVDIDVQDKDGKSIATDLLVDGKVNGVTPFNGDIPVCYDTLSVRKGRFIQDVPLTSDKAIVQATMPIRYESDWEMVKVDGKSLSDGAEVSFGTHTLEVETACQRSSVSIVVDESGIQHAPTWEEKTRTLKVTYLDEEKSSVSVPVILDGVQVGETPFEQEVSVCSKQVEVRGDRVEKARLTELEDWAIEILKVAPVIQSEDYTAKLIPAGTFTMGCTSEQGDDCSDMEKPAHQVTISRDFYLMESEVTQGLYQRVMGNNPSYFKGSNRPVEQVSWFDAVKFANKLSSMEGLERCYTINGNDVSWSNKSCNGWRLPTEAEWEYAARGGQSYKYAGSDNIDEVGWYYFNSGTESHPVGLKKPNGFGLYDMSGNVWEWVWDWYDSDYYSASAHPWIPQGDPLGPTGGSGRVGRGGGWYDVAQFVRVSPRDNNDPTDTYYYLGFRLCRTP